MAPAQCPECGRFLSKGLVASLAVESVSCPKCGTLLSASQFDLDPHGADARPDGPDEEPAGAAALRQDQPAVPAVDASSGGDASEATSVRPPDLDPSSVRGSSEDVLAGWDQSGGDVVDLSDRRGGSDAPPDAAVVAGAGVAGALLGMVVASRRGRGGVIGLLLGLLAGAAARRVWVLDDQG